ncbi:MAG: DUF1080 domain-containing protein [Acidobacteriota bacterium]
MHLRSIAGIVTLLLVFAGVACTQQAETPAVPEAEPAAGSGDVALNTLTPEEVAQGWELLFDGKSLDKWRGFRMETVPPGWQVEDGLLVFRAEHGGEGYGDLTTKEQFDDFELSLEWKISPCGNSGILFRVSEDYDQEWHTGPEYQIVDATLGCWSDYQAPEGERAPNSDLKPTQLSGANYDLHAPSENAVKPVGEWNHSRLVVNGPHVEHWLNGKKVVEYELWSPEWEALVAASKFKDYPKYGRNRTGHIVLQDHGKTLWFRNIKIRRLSSGSE